MISIDRDGIEALATAQRADLKALKTTIARLSASIDDLDSGLERAEKTRRTRLLRRQFADSTQEVQRRLAAQARTAETALAQHWTLSAIRQRTLAQADNPAQVLAYLGALSGDGLERAAVEAGRLRDLVAGAAVREEVQRRQDRKELAPEIGNHIASLVGNLLDPAELVTRDKLFDVIEARVDASLMSEEAITGKPAHPVRRIQALRQKEGLRRGGAENRFQQKPGDEHRHDQNTSLNIDC